MQRVVHIIICFVIAFLLAPPSSWGRTASGVYSLADKEHRAILQDVYTLTREHQQKRWYYKANYYFRSSMDLTQRNIFVLCTYNRRYFLRGGRHVFTEDYGDMCYYPNGMYPRKVRYTYSANGEDVPRGFLMEYFNTNIYGRMLQEKRFFSPLDSHNASYYKYRVDSVRGKYAFFTFKARHKNAQLVSGSFTYNCRERCVTKFRFRGMYNLFVFDETIYMGTGGRSRYFPKEMHLDYKFLYYGSVLKGSALSSQKYTLVQPHYYIPDRRLSKHDHNISSMFRLLCDSSAVVSGAEAMARYRQIPLTRREDSLFFQNPEKVESGFLGWINTSKWGKKRAARKAREKFVRDSLQAEARRRQAAMMRIKYGKASTLTEDAKSESDNLAFSYKVNTKDIKLLGYAPDTLAHVQTYEETETSGHRVLRTVGQMSEYLFRNYKFNTSPAGRFEVKSTDLSYSDGDGVRIRQDFLYVHLFPGWRELNVEAQAAYSFGRKEMVGRVRGDFLVQPRRDFHVTLEGGARNLTYNPLDAYKFDDAVVDSAGNAESITFVDAYVDLSASRELFPGFRLGLGVGWHQRMPLHISDRHREELNIRGRYTSMAPHVTLTYTPCERYYWRNNRKVIVFSNKPTYMLNYERAIKGAVGGTSEYERWEGMITHDMRLSPTMRLVWKAGGGLFTNRAHNDFIEYEYFNNGRIGYNWHDSRSGVFHLLDYKYYNQSNYYLRGHMTLESPTLLLRHVSTYLLNAERLYGSILFVKGVAPYVELGYGLSVKWADVSYFVSYLKEQGFKGGFKFNLHLFD